MDDFKIRLPEFHGPLDLMLYLVKRNEMDVRDISVAAIADQFRAYIDVLQAIDVEFAGDFLVAAATLLEMKSRMLLPRDSSTAPLETGSSEQAIHDDPRQDLVHQLLEYKRFKDAALRLGGRAAEVERRMPRERIGAGEVAEGSSAAVQTPELWDLVSAFGRIMQEATALEPEQIVADETPQHVYREQVLAAVRHAGRLEFRLLFTPPFHRLRLIGLFLALLDTIKNGDIEIQLDESNGTIWLLPQSAPAGEA